MYMYIYIYIYICVCVCVETENQLSTNPPPIQSTNPLSVLTCMTTPIPKKLAHYVKFQKQENTISYNLLLT